MMNRIQSLARAVLVLALPIMLAACSNTHVVRGDKYIKEDQWAKAVLEYRQAVHDSPDNVEIKSRLERMELRAAEYYYHRGVIILAQGNVDGAIAQFQQGIVAMPDNDKLANALKEAQSRKDAAALYEEGVKLMNAGKLEDARHRFQKALDTYPDYRPAAKQLIAVEKQVAGTAGQSLALTSTAPITLNFRETDIRDAYEFLAKSFGVNVIFDDGVKNVPVTLFAKDVTFEQGLELLLATSKTFYRKIGPNTILVAMDNKEKRGQYEDQIVRTFELNTVRAKDMADIIKGTMSVKKIVVNDQLNTLTVRDSDEVIRLVDRLIQANDKKRAEVMLDVEILEINRTKAENLGLDFGSYQVSASIPPYPIGGFNAAKANSVITLPSATLHFFKQDVDAKILASPQLRVLSGKSAKIHIGDRVPLIATTIQDATGQVRNTYDYKDIGIGLTAEPTVHLDNSVTVKLNLDVSSLGQNLGTAAQPAYSIGSRDAETSMLLSDGETAIIGGLIQDDENNTKVFIPGIGEIPALGPLFSSYNNSHMRSDVLLTITPHVVRSWEMPDASGRQFYSGSENSYLDHQMFAKMETTAVSPAGIPVQPRIDTNGSNSGAAPVPAPLSAAVPAPQGSQPELQAPAAPPRLGFSDTVYEVASGKDFTIKLTGQDLAGVVSVPIEILYNPQVLSFVRGEAGNPAPQSFNATADDAKGVASLSLAYPPNGTPKEASVVASLVMHAGNPGVSYLLYRTKTVNGANGEVINVQTQAARVVVK
jgi:general secretion pathway protein D